MKQTFFSGFSVRSTDIAAPTFNSSVEYCLQLFDVDVVGDEEDDDDDGDDILLFGAILNFMLFFLSFLEYFAKFSSFPEDFLVLSNKLPINKEFLLNYYLNTILNDSCFLLIILAKFTLD